MASGVEVTLKNDNLLIGPVAPRDGECVRLRAEYFGVPPPRLALRGVSSAVAWCPRSWGSILQLLAVAYEVNMSAAALSVRFAGEVGDGRELEPMFEAPLPSESAHLDGYKPGPSLAVEKDVLRAWSDLWLAYCNDSPTSFEQACRTPDPLLPELPGIARFRAGMFPRLTSNGIATSEFDEALLDGLTDEWATPSRVYVNALRFKTPAATWFARLGDGVVASRLAEWAAHPRHLVEVRSIHEDPERPMTQAVYRLVGDLSVPSRTIGECGPELPTGGSVAYGGSRQWAVKLEEAGKYHYVTCEEKDPTEGD